MRNVSSIAFPFPRRKLRRAAGRRALTWLAVLGYALTMAGVPAWPVPVVKDGGAPFPCQTHACGCVTAEQCWRDCCCFSLAERLAWAAREGVTPPAGAKDAWRSLPPVVAACCSSAKSSACCDAPAQVNETQDADKTPSAKEGTRVRWVLTVQARRCRGLGTEWNPLAGAVAPPPPRVSWRPDESPQGTVADLAIWLREVDLDRVTPPG